VVRDTTIAPGASSVVDARFSMHEGMGGPHLFEIVFKSNDPVEPAKVLTVKAEWPLP